MTHAPVLLAELLNALNLKPLQIYVDATFGGGGVTQALLEKGAAQVIALDRDPDAIAKARQLSQAYPGRLIVAHDRFSRLGSVLDRLSISGVHGIIFDLGVSSTQLESPDRGFSFRLNGPLDMRMDQSQGTSAREVVNTFSATAIAQILKAYGQEPRAAQIARAIIHARQQAPITYTHDLTKIIHQVTGPKRTAIDPATRTFQALRIYVNNELEELENGLKQAEKLLYPDGRLAVISFHSLEDRIVKNFMRERGLHPPRPSRHRPDVDREVGSLRVFSPIRPSEKELNRNPRARSARLRLAEKSSHAPISPPL